VPSRLGPILIGVACIAALALVTQLRVDNRHERMLDQNTPAAHAYEQFQREFGNDAVMIVALSGKPLFEFESLDAMVRAAEDIAQLPQVASVNGIPTIFMETFAGEDNEALEEELTSTPFYEGLFISKDRQVAGIVLELKLLEEPGANEAFAHAIDVAVKPLRDFGFRVDLVGDPIFESAIDKITMGESLRMFPIAAVLSLFVLIWLLRSLRGTIVVLVCNAAILLLTMGSMPATGHTLNLVTASSPLIVWVLSLANSIHVVSRFQQLAARTASAEEAMHETMRELRGSLIMSSITTSLGFLSLVTTNVSAIRDLGKYMALGMMFMLVVSLYLTPWLCLKWKVPPSPHVQHASRLLERLARRLTAHPRPALAVFGVFVAVAAYFALQVKTQPDSLKFLPKTHPVVDSYEFVQNNLTGLQSMEIVLATPGGWTKSEYWPAIEGLLQFLAEQEPVSRAFGPFDFLKKINQWDHDFDPAYFRLPESTERANELLGQMGDEDRRQLDRFVTNNGDRIRISVLTNTRDSSVFDEIIRGTQAKIETLPMPMAGEITGMATRMHEFNFGLLQNQVRSYGSSLVMVFLVILIGMRSLRLTLILLPPNIVPLLVVFTVMGILGISLDVATVMVASISLGIAVDETVIILSYYRWVRAQGRGNFDAIHSMLSDVGPACIVTSIVACIGFFTISMSIFIPISNFGLLCGIAMFSAVLSNLVLLPAVLALPGDTK
jgi:predicted RND superfamily exporter protein